MKTLFTWGIIGFILLLSALLLSACSPSSSGTGMSTASAATVEPAFASPLPPDFTPPPSSIPATQTPIPTLATGLTPTELKYRILDKFPELFFCDPDFYPIARAEEQDLARQRFPELEASAEEFTTILAHNNLAGQTTFTDEQQLLIYRAHKQLAAIPFTINAKGYQFEIQVAKTEGDGEMITGFIDSKGKISVQQRKPSFATCPICLAAGTLIDTPDGLIPVQNLTQGTLVWTTNRAGERIAASVLRVSRTIVPANHQVVHLRLSDDRELWVSPGHPTITGQRIGALLVGDELDGATIRSIERVAYTNYATYDLLPAGETGFYWANHILLASTQTKD